MARKSTVVRVSSKGQIVIPADFRRKMGIQTGHSLSIRAGLGDEIVLRSVDQGSRAVDEMLLRLRAAAKKLGGDPLREFHDRRRRDREFEARKHERRGH